MGAPIYHDLKGVNLNTLNELLNTNLEEAVSQIKWGTRTFTLKSGDNEYHVKMKDIVTKFQELAEGNADKDLIGKIHDRIIELDFEGDEQLSRQGFASMFMRMIKNIPNIFESSHLEKTHKVLEKNLIRLAKQPESVAILTIIKPLEGLLIGTTTQEERLNAAKEMIINGFDPDTKNAIRMLVQKEPEIAHGLLELFYSANRQLEEKLDHTNATIQFLNSMNNQILLS